MGLHFTHSQTDKAQTISNDKVQNLLAKETEHLPQTLIF